LTEKILVVDDEMDTRETMAMFLLRLGYEVQTAQNGQQGLQMLKKQPCDLLVLDVMMPIMNGFQMLEEVRRDPALKTIPVVMVTALDKTSDIVKAFELGANDYITKPYVNAELIARVSAALRSHRLEKEKKRGLQLQEFKKSLMELSQKMKQPLVQLTRCSSQLFKGMDEPNEDWMAVRRKLYDQCLRIQLILKQLEKVKSLES
jgi:DNA-binding response OmpR family regulator